jgi:hypothetical protein
MSHQNRECVNLLSISEEGVITQRPCLLSRAHNQGSDQPFEIRKASLVHTDSRHAAKEPELKETKKVSFKNAGFLCQKVVRR